MLSRFLWVVDTINHRVGTLAAYLLYGILGITLLEIISLAVANKSYEWVFETTIFLFVILCFLAGGYNLLHRRHVTMDLLYTRLSPRGQAIVEMLAAVCVFIFCGLMLWQSVEMVFYAVKFSYATDSIWGPILWPVKIFVPVGFLLFLLQGMAGFIRNLGFLLGKHWEYVAKPPREEAVEMKE